MVSDAYKRADKAAADKFPSSEKPTAFGQTDPRMFVLIGAGLLVIAVSGAMFYGDPPFYSGLLTGLGGASALYGIIKWMQEVEWTRRRETYYRNMLQYYKDIQGGND